MLGEGVGERKEAVAVDAAEPVEDHNLARRVYGVARRLDNASLRLLDASIIVGAWLIAYLAGYEGDVPGDVSGRPLLYLALPLATHLVANQLAGLYGPVWRYASVEEAARVVAAVGFGAAVTTIELMALSALTDTTLPVFTTPPVAALLILLGCGGTRFQARLFALERRRVARESGGGASLRTLIVGAGDAGAGLAQELRRDARGDVELVGFVDDDPELRGRSVRGLRVLGVTSDLPQVCRDREVDRILIALPSATRETLQPIIDLALETEAQVKVLPRASELMRGPLVRSLRDIDLADLLGREHAPVDTREIAGYLEGAAVLVTGAGGSIGSEIARQVAQFKPGQLLLLDRDESLLHDIVAELPGADPILLDIRDRVRVRELFERYRPDVVFHAAAHKHVPILETHPVEAVQTNVLGTWWLAMAAADYGCDRFVLISTDKAAGPCSVMGATKRAAELVVFEVGSQHPLPFAAVRFGNVLGSRGSVVPTFLRQILDGGPVTVTSAEMTRYFMTIPEAVSLVLQAGAMADERKVFLLDMGEPVSILELARQMIRLSGLRPEEDIEIRITGARPGERLHERLHEDDETVTATEHPSISTVTPKSTPDVATLVFFLELLERKCAEGAAGPAVKSLLVQLLRHCGIDCELRTDEIVDLTGVRAEPLRAGRVITEPARELSPAPAPLLGAGARTKKQPALLGGRATFTPSLPFARPARPPLEQVWRRLMPSYERGMLTNGDLVRELEERVADRLGVGHVVAVSSCTSGLMLALQALVTDRDGPVVLPSFTFSATGHAVRWNGRIPRFADCDRATFQIDALHADELLDGAAALVATHVFGAPCDPFGLVRGARARGVPVLFDAAHAFGATANGCMVGGFGDAEVFSLTPTKVLVAGEGGLVSTCDEALADALRIGRDYANPGDYNTRFAGLNARMSEFHAAMALESLERFDDALDRRRELAASYRKQLADIPGIRLQEIGPNDESTFKDFTIAVDERTFGLSRDQLVRVLAFEGIDTRRYFDPPVHRQDAYADVACDELPATNEVAASVVSLPIYPDLRDSDIDRVVDAIALAHSHADALVTVAGPAVAPAPGRPGDVIDLRVQSPTVVRRP